MQELVKVKGFKVPTFVKDERWFHLPTSEDDKTWLKDYYVKVPDEYAESNDEAKYYVREYLTDDEELPKLLDLPSNLYELDEFLTRWSELDKSQKQTTVALVEYGVEPFKAVAIAEDGLAVLTDVVDPYLGFSRDKKVGEYYFEILDDYGFFDDIPEFCRRYFDVEKFGRDVQLSGGDGFWSEIYSRWLDYPQGTYRNRLWHDWVVKGRKK